MEQDTPLALGYASQLGQLGQLCPLWMEGFYLALVRLRGKSVLPRLEFGGIGQSWYGGGVPLRRTGRGEDGTFLELEVGEVFTC